MTVRRGVFAVGTVGALESFSRIAGAICSGRKTREHGRGCRSWVRVLEGVKKEEGGRVDVLAVTSRVGASAAVDQARQVM